MPLISNQLSSFTPYFSPLTQLSNRVVFSANTGPVVIRKLAILPASRLPTLSYTPSKVAGTLVKASNALVSVSPISNDFRRLVINCLGSLRSAVVKQKGIFAFSKAPGFEGASSQCFISARDTALASFGSSTSIA